MADTAGLHNGSDNHGHIYIRYHDPDFVATIMGILQMHRNGCLLRLHAAHGFLYGIYCRIALGCTGHVCNCLGKNDLDSGIPTRSTACAAAVATQSA